MGIIRNQNSRRDFLVVLGTAALAGCSSTSGLVLPASRKIQNLCGPPTCEPGGGLPTSLSGLTLSEIQAISTSQIKALTADQIGSLTHTQLGVFRSTQCLAFHGEQANPLLAKVAAAQQGYPSPPPTMANPPPPTWTPATPGSAFWGWFGGVVGGIVGGTAGAMGGPIGGFIGSQVGAMLGSYGAQGEDAYYNFWNSDEGAWNSVDVSLNPAESVLDSDGFTLTGSYDAPTDTVTITVYPN